MGGGGRGWTDWLIIGGILAWHGRSGGLGASFWGRFFAGRGYRRGWDIAGDVGFGGQGGIGAKNKVCDFSQSMLLLLVYRFESIRYENETSNGVKTMKIDDCNQQRIDAVRFPVDSKLSGLYARYSESDSLREREKIQDEIDARTVLVETMTPYELQQHDKRVAEAW